MSDDDYERLLKRAIVITVVFFLVEIIGGFVSGSLSLLSDAGHMLVDGLSLGISLGAITIAHQLPSKGRTFGFHRIEILAALVNGVILLILSGWILLEAYRRFLHPSSVNSTVMLWVAAVGLIANLVIAYSLYGSHDLNIQGAFLHVLGDTLSSIAVVVGALLISITGLLIIDPLLSAIIVVVLLSSTVSLIWESVTILLQFTPRDVDFDAMVRDIESVEGVDGVHNIHIWALCSHINVFDGHIYSCERNVSRLEGIKKEVKERLGRYNIQHSTLEIECEECQDCRIVQEVN